MQTFETQAFVFRRFPATGKQDIRISLFTQKYGKRYCIAKGALSIRSGRASVLDSGNIINAVLIEQSTGLYVRTVDLVSRLTGIKRTIDKATMLLLAFDVLDTLLPLEQPEEAVYENIKQFVRDLDHTAEPKKVTIKWVNTMILTLGYPPIRKGDTIAQLLVGVEELVERSFVAPWQFMLR